MTDGLNFDEGNDIVTTHCTESTMTDYCAPLRHHTAGSPPNSSVALGKFDGGGDPGGNPGGMELLHAASRSAEDPANRTLGGNHDFHSRSRARKDDSQGGDLEEGVETRDFDGEYTGTEPEDDSESAGVDEGNLRDQSAGYSRFEQQEEEATMDDAEQHGEREQSTKPRVTEHENGDATGGGSRSNSLQSHQLRAPQYPLQAEKATRQQQPQQQETRAVEEALARAMAPPRDSVVREDTQEPSHLSQGNGIYEQTTQQCPPRASEENKIFDQQTQEQQSPKETRREMLQKPEDDNLQHQQEICRLPVWCEARFGAVEKNDDGASDSDRSDLANHDESTSEDGRSGSAGGHGGGDSTGAGATDSSFDKPDIQATSAAEAAGPVNRLNEVEQGKASRSRVNPRSPEANRKGRDGDLEVMKGAENMDSGEDEYLPEDELTVMRDQREREAMFREKVGDGFLKITNSYTTASSAIKGVETEQVHAYTYWQDCSRKRIWPNRRK